MVRIGNKTFNTNVFLAPLSACSDLAFRLMAREYGAGFCFFEMVDANSLVHHSTKSQRIIRTLPEDQPVGAQLLGADPEVMLRAAGMILEKAEISLLDVNAACPAKKVVKKGAGSCFLKEPEGLYKILERLSKALPVPITVKLRSGFDKIEADSVSAIAKRCQDAGASALFVHGRSRSQENYGPVDYGAIRAVKQAVSIPVFGSGNVLNPALAEKMLVETGVDGVLVAKGSFGNPWIFRDIEAHLSGQTVATRTDLGEKITALKKHLAHMERFRDTDSPAYLGVMGKVAMWYLKGFAEASRVRERVFQSKSYAEMTGLLETIPV